MPVTWIDGAAIPAFLIPGPREVLIVGLVVLALYGRSGSKLLLSTRYGRLLSPFIRASETKASPRRASPDRPADPPAPATRPSGRLYWALVLIAASAAAAWAATRALVPGPGRMPRP